jgi:O-6-methylguanine DNA methyltransferase
MSSVLTDYVTYDSPVGCLYIYFDAEDNVVGLYFKCMGGKKRLSAVNNRIISDLDGYFNNAAKGFSFKFHLNGTDFQQRVWRCLLDIKHGETKTYTDIAEQIGKPSAVRAAANAVAKNPISIFIPCHRVIGKDGSLTGFAGGLDVKRRLLEHEGHTI